MKWKDFKLAAYVSGNQATLAAKKKNGLLFTLTDTHVNGNSASFTGNLGSCYAVFVFAKHGKKWHIEISIPEEDILLEFCAKTESQYKQFLSIDYHGFKLKH